MFFLWRSGLTEVDWCHVCLFVLLIQNLTNQQLKYFHQEPCCYRQQRQRQDVLSQNYVVWVDYVRKQMCFAFFGFVWHYQAAEILKPPFSAPLLFGETVADFPQESPKHCHRNQTDGVLCLAGSCFGNHRRSACHISLLPFCLLLGL